MKTNIQILFLVILCLNISKIEAQQPPRFDAINKAGIVKYKSKRVIKKLKISENSIKEKIRIHIQEYNKEMDRLLLLHSDSLKDLQNEFDTNVKIAIQNRDRSRMDGVKTKIQQIIPPIRKAAEKHRIILNENLAPLLSGKQYKKWLRYSSNK
jgi:hypothetical protein